MSSSLESLVNKGMLWGFWLDETRSKGTIAINTHMKAGPPVDVKEKQFGELVELIHTLRRRFSSAAGKVEVLVAGDFNCFPQHPFIKAFQSNTGLKLISNPNLSTHRRGVVVDMVFSDFGEAVLFSKQISAAKLTAPETTPKVLAATKESPWLSDHHMVLVRCSE